MKFIHIAYVILEVIEDGLETILDKLLGKDHALKSSFGKPRKLISRRNLGFCIDGKRNLTLKQSRSNVLTCAPSGKGKTQVSVYPFLLRAQGDFSLIINDPSSELSLTIPYLESQGIRCHILDFGKKTGLYFNPLVGCEDGNITQMRKIAKTLTAATVKERDFFTIAAEDTLVLFMQFLIESTPKVYHNIANLHRLILIFQGSPKVIENLFADKASESVWVKFKALVGTSENTKKSILASCLAATSFIGEDPMLADISSVNTIGFHSLRKEPQAIFVHVPVGDISYYEPILNLFFQEFYRFAFAELPQKDDLDIMMVLDEFDTLGAIQDFSTIISNSRKAKIPQQIILQSVSQLDKYGKKAKNILNNCNVKCFYGGLGDETFELERTLGKYTYTDPKTKREGIRSLMTASEIRELDKEILVVPSGKKPLKVKVTESFKQRELVSRLNMEMPETNEEEIPLEYTVQYLPLDEYRAMVDEAESEDEV